MLITTYFPATRGSDGPDRIRKILAVLYILLPRGAIAIFNIVVFYLALEEKTNEVTVSCDRNKKLTKVLKFPLQLANIDSSIGSRTDCHRPNHGLRCPNFYGVMC